MPKSFIQKTFGRWLSKSHPSFQFYPVIVKRRKSSIHLRFAGISQKIDCVIARHCADIYVNHKGECWDILISFEILERKSSIGYYCGLCELATREFFATREDLWIKHCFEPLLEWLNGNFDESQWAYLFATDGMTWVEIKEKDDEMLENKNFVHAFPVVERMNKAMRRIDANA